tara:strand:+ start:107 stop:352 length:246 start_codon:yes stop_codon:yes gene_type:complete
MTKVTQANKKAEIFAAYKASLQKIEELEAKLDNKELSLSDYRNDFNRRLATHDKEFTAALKDMIIVFGAAKKQVVELFPVN